ncbi:RNA polymerase sigma factor FliA [Psychrosphaera sp. B3R10]|uniref:RNA polymerase sigma factor FliA n=1 Tax=unclassified Psychrosphaera TaxID=2641570 RepID=UPI001C0989F6|nr:MULTISPECIES: RNA polymerase sigma factor FliA [unclassified Psychrosphaera]MBU2884082.1 RNA polymerase sigma factor FliA [Psychrosphaera sp. I2R16]MBU2988212.1 RNA polymerase sigma factor FliA [Psychrosphaera sp. B3R10]
MNNKVAAAYEAKEQSLTSLVNKHGVLVKRIAHHLAARLPDSVQVDDLIQAGMIGLIEASKNFDGSKGASFETYAGIRIRGSMLDEIRRGDWTPRSVHRNTRLVANKISALEAELGRDVKDVEVAAALDISLAQYHQMLKETSAGRVLDLDSLGVAEDVVTKHTDGSDDVYDGVEGNNFKSSMIKAIKSLPEREGLILSLYYDDELNLREIGNVLNVSESRVSQIHSQAMVRLRARLKEWL